MSQAPVVPVQRALASLLTPSLVHSEVLMQSNLLLKIRHFSQHSDDCREIVESICMSSAGC